MIRNTTRETAHVSSTYTWPYQDTYKSIGRVPDNIDELLRDCGYATYMQYTAEGSGTMSYMAGVALTRTFGNPYTFRFGTEKDGNDVEHQTLYCDLPYGFVNFNASGFQGVFGIYAEDLTDGSSWVIAPDLQDRDTIPCGSGYAGSSEQYKDFYFYYFIDGATGLKPGHDYRMSFGVKDDREGVWRSLLCVEGEVAYDIHYTGDITTSTISEERVPAPVMNAIGDIAANPALSDDRVRVYDLQGRQVYAAPASSFNLWDVPARGVLVVRQNGTTRKVVR